MVFAVYLPLNSNKEERINRKASIIIALHFLSFHSSTILKEDQFKLICKTRSTISYQPQSTPTMVLISITVTSLLLSLIKTAVSLDIGTKTCSCAPSTYEFILDFSLFCPPVNITLGDAVQATSCLISPFGNPDIGDLIPIAVQSIDILELGQDLRILVQENIEGNFGDGDTFQYISVAADRSNINSTVDIPRALQLNLVGVNANDEPVINVYIITFTNSCGTYPVLSEGQSAGWTRFVS
jgi:hypothetical protein